LLVDQHVAEKQRRIGPAVEIRRIADTTICTDGDDRSLGNQARKALSAFWASCAPALLSMALPS
jgi:hypothetical protein